MALVEVGNMSTSKEDESQGSSSSKGKKQRQKIKPISRDRLSSGEDDLGFGNFAPAVISSNLTTPRNRSPGRTIQPRLVRHIIKYYRYYLRNLTLIEIFCPISFTSSLHRHPIPMMQRLPIMTMIYWVLDW